MQRNLHGIHKQKQFPHLQISTHVLHESHNCEFFLFLTDTTRQATIHTQPRSSNIFVQHDKDSMTQHSICKDTNTIKYIKPRMRNTFPHEPNTRHVRQIIPANQFKPSVLGYNLQRTARAYYYKSLDTASCWWWWLFRSPFRAKTLLKRKKKKKKRKILLYCLSFIFLSFQRTFFSFLIRVSVNFVSPPSLLFCGMSLPLATHYHIHVSLLQWNLLRSVSPGLTCVVLLLIGLAVALNVNAWKICINLVSIVSRVSIKSSNLRTTHCTDCLVHVRLTVQII